MIILLAPGPPRQASPMRSRIVAACSGCCLKVSPPIRSARVSTWGGFRPNRLGQIVVAQSADDGAYCFARGAEIRSYLDRGIVPVTRVHECVECVGIRGARGGLIESKAGGDIVTLHFSQPPPLPRRHVSQVVLDRPAASRRHEGIIHASDCRIAPHVPARCDPATLLRDQWGVWIAPATAIACNVTLLGLAVVHWQ